MRTLEIEGLPASLEAERFVLGAVLLDGDRFAELALEPEDFTLRPHQLIWRACMAVAEAGRQIDRITVYEALKAAGEVEAVGGLSALVSLDDGMPQNPNVEGYFSILRDKRLFRDVITASRRIEEMAAIGAQSPQDVLTAALASIGAIGGAANGSGGFSVASEIIRAAGGLQKYLDGQEVTGIQTGFPRFDALTGGIGPGELWVVAAETGGGKTTWVSQIMQQVAASGVPVAIASLEMTNREVLDGMICRSGEINTRHMRISRARFAAVEAAREVAQLPIHFCDMSALTIPRLMASLRKLKADHGVGLVMVDYLQLMPTVGRFGTRAEAVASLTRGLKLGAMELGLGIVAISQLSRGEKNVRRRPVLSDLKESSSIEQDANLVAFLHGEWQESEMDWYPWEVIVAKRRGGPCGTIANEWRKETGTFRER